MTAFLVDTLDPYSFRIIFKFPHPETLKMHLSALVVLLPLVSAAPWATKRSAPAPLTLAKTQTADNANKYIVKFREGLAGNVVHNAMNVFPHDADHVFENIFPGFAASLDPKALAVLREHPDVRF